MAEYELPGVLTPQQVASRLTAADVVTLRDWETRMETRRERNLVMRAIFDSGAMVLNGAGYVYDWGFPKPWEYDGNEPGSALELDPRR